MFLNHQLYGSFDDIFSSLPISLPVLVMLPCFFCLHNYPFGFLHSTLSSWVCLQPFTHLPSLLRRSPSCCTEPSLLLPADLVWVPRGRLPACGPSWTCRRSQNVGWCVCAKCVNSHQSIFVEKQLRPKCECAFFKATRTHI